MTAEQNCTFYANSAVGGAGHNNNNGNGLGGAIFLHNGHSFLDNDTFVSNSANDGAGLFGLVDSGHNDSTLGVDNCLFSDPAARDFSTTSPDGSSYASYGGESNVFANSPKSPQYFSNSIITSTPGLGSFGDHGGPTSTVPLLLGSPAIGQADAFFILQPTDQRGVTRQSEFPRHRRLPVPASDDPGRRRYGPCHQPQYRVRPVAAGRGPRGWSTDGGHLAGFLGPARP